MKNVFTFSKETNQHSLNYSDAALKSALKVIEIEPRFPFSYYAVSYIYFQQKNKNWIQYAKKAVSILEYTNKIQGCNEVHSVCLAKLNSFIKTHE